MLDIDDNLRQIYKNDSLPVVKALSYKQLKLYFPELNLTITNDKIDGDSFKLTESLCSDIDLSFGACESAQLNVTVADISQDLKGQTMIVTQIVNDTYTMPLGTYKVDSVKKQSDLRFKDITAYDQMKSFDVDVTAWYNSLTFPMSLGEFRSSLCAYVGITAVTQTLPNDSMTVTKTITPTVLSGRDVLMRIAEINGTFGHITRDNKLKFIGLSSLGLYPFETLYPAEDLFPAENSEYLSDAGYKNSEYEDYEVQSIDKLQIREEEGDIGVTVGNGDNGYIIEGNFLVFGKTASELTTIANNLLLMIKNKRYRPHNTNIIGLPYLEVGDTISIITSTDVIETFVLTRTLSGVQVLNDEIKASGSEHRVQDFGIASKIEQLRSQSMRIKADVDGLGVRINGEGGLSSQIEANANGITLEAQRAQEQEIELAGAISVTAGEVALKVSKGDVSSQLSVESGKITLGTNRLIVNSTNFKLDGEGNAEFSGDVKGADIYGSTFTAEQIFGSNKIVLTMKDIGFTIQLYESGDYTNPTSGVTIDYQSMQFIGDASTTNKTECSVGRNGLKFSYKNNTIFEASTSGVKANGYYVVTTGNIKDYIPGTSGITASTRTSTTAGGSLVTFSNTSGSSDVACASYVQAMVSGTSDERLKTNIKPLDTNTDKYMQLNPIEWDWVLNDGHDIGLGAHELAELYPDMIRKNFDISEEEKKLCPDGVWEIKYKCLHAEHIRMIQKHEIEITDMVSRIEKLEKRGEKGWIKRIAELIGRTNRQHQQH